MLSVIVFLPVVVAAVLMFAPKTRVRLFAWSWIVAAAIDLLLVVVLWIGYGSGGHGSGRGGFAYETNIRWLPTLGSGYHIGVDGFSLPLIALTGVLFLACAIYSLREQKRSRAWIFLFLQSVSLGLFVSLDLLVFFVFFDLSIVAMYFIIAGWGHAGAAKAALQFFLYTFIGSLALLLGFIGLYLASTPHTFDIVELVRQNPLKGSPALAGVILFAISIGLAIKTPTVPFHTWLPPAHTEAPTAGSVILAGILLKMGTYGFVRIAMPILPDAWRAYAMVFVIVGVVSVLYGALVAMAQSNLKRMVAYTSVNHMGYIILGLGAAGLAAGSNSHAAVLAVSGAVTQMVSHGLLTGALFLLAGVLYARGDTYDMGAYGGVARRTPLFTGLMAVAVFGSLGLPALSGFIAEFQIFTGSLGAAPVPTALSVVGIVITAALLLRMFQRIFLGGERQLGGSAPRMPATAARPMRDVFAREFLSIAPLLTLSVIIGIVPAFLLNVIDPAARTLVTLVSP
jgi:NADH-quinone oxidoreductase subunit M